MEGARRGSIGHVPALDGLRGLGVSGVLLFHAGGLLRGGYLGVDLFFVLSGYLITSILIAEHRRGGKIDLRAFWVRRARRLLPAVLALMPAIALYAACLATPAERASLRGDAWATLGYVANWRAIFLRRSYWELFQAPSPLEHTWSLSIEEQFYVVWPLFVAFVLALRRGVRPLLALCLALAGLSALAMICLYDGSNASRVYLGTDTRGAAILLGAALAASGLPSALPRWKGSILEALGVASLVGLALAWGGLDGQSDRLYRGGFWLSEVACATLIACAVIRPEGPVARLLSLRPLRALGTISYGVYLWHWPVYVVLTEERLHLRTAGLLVIRIAVTLAIASVSYVALEKPIRERGLAWGRPLVVVPSAFVLAIALLFTTTATRGTPIASAKALDGSPPSVADRAPLGDPGARAVKLYAPSKTFPADLEPGTLRVLVLGDSVGISLGDAMFWNQPAAGPAFVIQDAVGDCSILDGIVPVHSLGGEPHGNGNCADRWELDAAKLAPDVALVVLGGAYFSTVKGGGRWRSVCDDGWRAPYAKRLQELLVAIAPSVRRRVVALAAYPVGHWQTPPLDDKVDCYNAILKEAASGAGADLLDLNAHLCPDRVCTVMSQDQPVRPDGLHFTGRGADETARWVLRALATR